MGDGGAWNGWAGTAVPGRRQKHVQEDAPEGDPHPPLALLRPSPDTSLMSPSDEERRYSDREFALILRMASKVPAGPDPAPPQRGLTLPEIREIAMEVGIDPEGVSRAALLLTSVGDAGASRLIGGHPRHRMEHTIAGRVPPEAMNRVIEVARRGLDTQGETREVLGALEWKGSTGTATITVSIVPGEGETTLQASTDRTESLTAIYAGVGLSVTVVIAVTMGKLVFGETGPGIAAAFLSGFPPGLLLARTLWKRSTKKWRERLLHLMDAMAREAEVVVGRSGEEPGAPPNTETGKASTPPGEA
jgi:hypothetical protein